MSTPETGDAGTDDQIRAALGALPTSAVTPNDVATAAATAAAEDAGQDTADQLGEAGKAALDKLRTELREERRRRVAAEREAAAKNDADEGERIRREAETAANGKANARIVRAEIRALAAGRFADPADAVIFLDPAEFEVDADGEVDREEISAALAALLARKPHLGNPTAQGSARAPRPDRSQGAADAGAPSTAQQFATAMQDKL